MFGIGVIRSEILGNGRRKGGGMSAPDDEILHICNSDCIDASRGYHA